MRRGSLPLNALRAFEAAGRLGSMGAAAVELGLSHSAISRHVRGLEAQLGLRLFEGPRNAQRLTAEGRALLPDLSMGFSRIDAAVSRVVPDGQTVLDLSCLGTLAMRWLIPRLHRFRQRHPGTDVRLTTDDGPVDFARSRIDLAIRVGAGPWPGAEVTPLFRERAGPVHAPGQDPATLPRLATRTRPDAWEDWGGLGEPADWYEHFYFMIEAAVGGLGFAVVPEVLVADDISSGRLVAAQGFRDTGKDYVVLLPAEHARPAAKRLARWLAEEAPRG